MPCATGTEPDQVAGWMTSAPRVSWVRKLSVTAARASAGCTESGVAGEGATERSTIVAEGPCGVPGWTSPGGPSARRSVWLSSTPPQGWASLPGAGTAEAVADSLMICRQAVEGAVF